MGSVRLDRPPFQVLRATEEDIITLASVEAIANDNQIKTKPEDNLFKIRFGQASREIWEDRGKKLIEQSRKDPSMKMYKGVVEESDGTLKTIAFANWFFDTQGLEIEDWKDIEWPSYTNGPATNEIIGSIQKLRQKHMSGKKHGFLQVLATLPEYRGMGIGSALLRRGLDDAANEGLDDFYLIASTDGHDLYEKFGFCDVGPLEMSLEKYGGASQAPIMAMRKTVYHE